jgi:hypothetical protein
VGKRIAIGAVTAWSVIVVVVAIIGTVAAVIFVFIAPIQHTLALLEMVGNVVDSFLSRSEAMPTESTFAWEFVLRINYTRLLVVVGVNPWVNIPEMLEKMVFSKAGLHVIDRLVCA